MATQQLNETLKALSKKYGDHIIRKGSELPNSRKIALDIPMYDYVTTGGTLVNHITEFYGDFSSLKSYFMYRSIGQFQKYDWANNVPGVIVGVRRTKKGREVEEEVMVKRGYIPAQPARRKLCALIDFEGSYDKSWGEMLGVDNEELVHIVPESLNTGIDIIQALLMDPDYCLVCIDSMIATGADAETDASMENEQMAVNARFWNKATRKMKGSMNKNPEKDITLMAVNGFYSKVGITFGNPEVVKNGEQFKLAKDVSIRTTALKELKGKVSGVEIVLGRNIKLTNKKNKFGTPFLEGTLFFHFADDDEVGTKAGTTDVATQLIDIGTAYGLIERAGNTYSFQTTKGVGMENFKKALAKSGDIKVLKEECYSRFK